MQQRAPVRLALFLVLSLTVSACSGGGSPSTPSPSGGGPSTPTPGGGSTSTPTPTAASAAAFTCPTSDTATSVARGVSTTARRAPARNRRSAQASDGLIAVTYARQTLSASRTTLAAREVSLGAKFVNELDFPHAGLSTRVLSVAPSAVTTFEASLRAQAGVRSVGSVGRRYATTVKAPYYPPDPYFNGFLATQTGGSPATYHVQPYVESQNVPGQWGMHAVGLDNAFGYSQTGNIVNNAIPANVNALGSLSVKIAIIDTGQDVTHPELASKVTYQKCFITDSNGTLSTSNFTTDADGHGTDVAGIAAGETGNGLGYTSAGGNSVIYGYRVYPTPDDNCLNENTSDARCGASTYDIAHAIVDAIANNVNVISLSLGGGGCTNGVDDDTIEGNAIAEAIAADKVVVAAAGNAGPPLEAPACDSGVIAAGATSLADGQPNGARNSNGTATLPIEYVASYSAYGTPATSLRNSSAWGIVAPGGDPASNTDGDRLHWIDNIWTSTPFMNTPTDTSFAGLCTPDYGGGSIPDCRIEIAGTSMATPLVAGAAALILAVAPSYQSPTAMKALLCGTADDIHDPNEGCGRLNVYRAMATALADPTKP